MAFWKEKLTIQEVERRQIEQKRITAEYLQGEYGEDQKAVEVYVEKMDEVATPLDLRAIADKLKFK